MSSPRAPKGTYDLLPDEAALRDHVVATAARVFGAHGYRRVVTPEFEETGLFERGVGEATDIVRKEMYTFEDKGGRSLTLRPEGTAPICRLYVEHGLHKWPQPVKLWYYCPMFRYERPQAGRYREHYQLGAEAIGSAAPEVDAEVIAMLAQLLRRARRRAACAWRSTAWGTRPAGPPTSACCATYLARARGRALRRLPRARRAQPAAHVRLQGRDLPRRPRRGAAHRRAPLPGLPGALRRGARTAAPRRARARSSTSASCAVSTTTRARRSSSASDRLGAQSGVGGGGRYDGLVEQIGGPPTPGVGFGSGLERIALAMGEARGCRPRRPAAFVVAFADERRGDAFVLAEELRRGGPRRRAGPRRAQRQGPAQAGGPQRRARTPCCSASRSCRPTRCASGLLPAAAEEDVPAAGLAAWLSARLSDVPSAAARKERARESARHLPGRAAPRGRRARGPPRRLGRAPPRPRQPDLRRPARPLRRRAARLRPVARRRRPHTRSPRRSAPST